MHSKSTNEQNGEHSQFPCNQRPCSAVGSDPEGPPKEGEGTRRSAHEGISVSIV